MDASRKKSAGWGALVSIVITIVLPVIVLTRFSDENSLGPVRSLILALVLPLGYGGYEYIKTRSYNFYSILGAVGVLLTGGIALLQIETRWLAVKEAAVPIVIGGAIWVSRYTKWPLVTTFLDQSLNMSGIESLAREHGQDLSKTMNNVTYMIVASFLLSGILNFTLTRLIVVSPTGTSEFNQELGKLTALSYPVIALPSMLILIGALFYLLLKLEKITGMEVNEIVKKYSK